MNETKILEVTQDDIDSGVRSSSRDCPFARAAHRLFASWESVTVVSIDVHVANYRTNRGWETWDLDKEGTAAVHAYDTGLGMKPGRYTLTLTRNSYGDYPA